MDIASFSMGASQAFLSQSVTLALTKKTMDMAQQNAGQMIQMLQAPHPTLGNSVDLKG